MTENKPIFQEETPETLADRLLALSDQIRKSEGIRLWKFLYQMEVDDISFLEGVERLEMFFAPKPASYEKARQMVQEADQLSQKPHDWPLIEEDEFIVTVDIECAADEDNRPYLVLSIGGQEVYRRPTSYGSTRHLQRVTEDMRPAYQGRVKDVVLKPGVENALLMDSYHGGEIRRVLRPIRKDFLKRRNNQ